MSDFRKEYFDFSRKQTKKLEQVKRVKLNILARVFAIYGVGDIICDSTKIISITSVFGSLTLGEPCIVYKGIELTKKNKPKKSGQDGYIFTDENHKGIELIKSAS